MGTVKIAEDVYQNNLQFAHLKTSTSLNIAAARNAQINTVSDVSLVVTPISAGGYINVATSTTTCNGTGTGDSRGKFIPLGSSYTMIVRKDEYINASVEINVVELGEI